MRENKSHVSTYLHKEYVSDNALLNEYLDYLRNNEMLNSSVRTYGQIIARFLEHLKNEYGIDLGTENVSEVTPLMMTAYYSTMRHLAVTTRNLTVIALRSMFRYCMDMGYTTVDACAPLRVLAEPREKHEDAPEEKMLTVDQATRMVGFRSRNNGIRNQAIITLILATGLRAFEVVELNVGQVRRMENGMLYCRRKGDIWRHVPVPQAALDRVHEYLSTRGGIASRRLRDDEPLFLSNRGGRMSVRTLQHSINEIQKKLDIKTGVHILRHTAISGVQNVGGVAVARDIASHSTVNTTNRYLHSTHKERLEAAEQLPWLNAGDSGGEDELA